MLPGGNGLPSASNLRTFVVDPDSPPRSTWRPIPPAATCSTPTSRRPDPPHPVPRRQQPAHRRGHRQPDQRPGAADRAVQRQRVLRPRWRPAHLFVGSERRWHLRRLDRRQPQLHLLDRRDLTVTLRVTDSHGASTVSAPVTITVGSGNTAPAPVIDTPPPASPGRWATPSASPGTPPTRRTAPCRPPP